MLLLQFSNNIRYSSLDRPEKIQRNVFIVSEKWRCSFLYSHVRRHIKKSTLRIYTAEEQGSSFRIRWRHFGNVFLFKKGRECFLLPFASLPGRVYTYAKYICITDSILAASCRSAT